MIQEINWSVILSGRPLIIEDHLGNWDGLIAAWLPGMAGEGVSDVYMGIILLPLR